jgi:ribosomal-protein-alanine N-acetyltransferase
MNPRESIGTIDTERLRLRAWTVGDAEDLFDYAKNPNVGPHGGWKPHESVEESVDIINSLFLEKYQSWAIVLKETGKVIGSIGYEEDSIRKEEGCMELGYALAFDQWGKGLMTEAAKAVLHYGFSQMDLTLVSIYHNPLNRRSGRVVEKCGFYYEGTLRRANKVYNGEIRDVACYSMTKMEHEELPSDVGV